MSVVPKLDDLAVWYAPVSERTAFPLLLRADLDSTAMRTHNSALSPKNLQALRARDAHTYAWHPIAPFT